MYNLSGFWFVIPCLACNDFYSFTYIFHDDSAASGWFFFRDVHLHASFDVEL